MIDDCDTEKKGKKEEIMQENPFIIHYTLPSEKNQKKQVLTEERPQQQHLQ